MRRCAKRARRAGARLDEPGDARLPHHPDNLQICVHVIEGRNLMWTFPLSGSSYVMLVYGRKKRRTTIQKKMVEPVYRESFIFETYKTLRDLEQSRIWVCVMETRCCSSPRLMGQGAINLASIWARPNHEVDEKWIQLTSPTLSEPVGFVKVGVIITFKEEIEVINMQMQTKTNGPFNYANIRPPPSSPEQQRANYQFIIFAALGLNVADRRQGKLLSTFVKVTFCGLMGKTGVKHHDNNPAYSEQISMVEMFPNPNQKVCFEVCLHENVGSKVWASTYLNLDWISHDGDNGFVPTFGPSLLHMYGTLSHQPEVEGPYHRGALLIALRTDVPYDWQKLRSVSVEPVKPLKLDTFWHWESYCIYCSILELSMIDGWFTGKCGAFITIGELFNEYGQEEDAEGGEFMAMLNEIRSRRLNYWEQDLAKAVMVSLKFAKGYPVLQLAAKLPDFRFRIYRNNILGHIVADLSTAVENVENSLNSLNGDSLSNIIVILSQTVNDAAAGTQMFLDAAESERLKEHATQLDDKQLTLMTQEIDPHGWPDIIIRIISGGARVAYYRMSPADILYSPEVEQIGKDAGRVQTLYLKPLKCLKHQNASTKCHCKIAKIELQFWMGLYKQYYAFEECLPLGYKVKLRGYNMFLKANYMIFECRVFIYDAKLKNIADTDTKSNVFARVHILNKVCETMFHPKSSLLTWNQVLKTRLEIYTTAGKISLSPPEVTVDVVENPSQSKEYLLGRVNIRPIVDDRQSYEFAPKLRSYELYCGAERVGEILMSVQLLQIPEQLIKSTSYTGLETNYTHDDCNKDFSKCDNYYEVEVLPSYMVPQKETYKVDVKWWGLRKLPTIKKPCVVLEINNLTVKSDLVLDKKSNCNFPQGHSSYTFEAPLSEPHCPALSIKLYDCSTFGRTLFLGVHVVKNPNKFLIKWISKAERENHLRGINVTATQFHPASQVYVTNEKPQREEFFDEIYCDNTNHNNAKFSKWRKLISRKQPKDEQYILLPMFDSETKPNEKIERIQTSERRDWWQRYYSSTNRSKDPISEGDKIVIYPSELEKQPEFSKFKDWCFHLKFHNNQENKLVREKDNDYCGSLKAGIAIYNWPPLGDTVAVNNHGVDLSKGYYSEYPSNDPAKFLVRVYVLKVLNVVSKDYTEKHNYSITISVGKKRFKDRQKHSQPLNSSMIGEMYELLCTIPEDYLLTLYLYDTEDGSTEELVGITTVDLEDRIYTKHKACVGLSPKYDLTNPTNWRDPNKPSEILEQICAFNHLPAPAYPDVSTVVLNGVQHKNNNADANINLFTSENKENICLSILHHWHTMPVCGYHLVPEHLETRTLHRPDRPGLSQGQLLMWIDIYPFDDINIPPPVDITPPKIEEYELRIIVWDVQELKILNSLDIFVKGFIDGSDQAQTTDVCYGVTAGACFNWRMIFHLYYQHSEKMLIIKDKGPYTEYEKRLPPNFVIQVIDNNTEQILASTTLNLTSFPRGLKQAQHCSFKTEERKKVNLFSTRSIRAWWWLDSTSKQEKKTVMGAIDVEMTLLPKEQADLIPVGFGRGPPSPLPDPHTISSVNLFPSPTCRSHLISPTNANCFLCYLRGRESNDESLEYFCGKTSMFRRSGFLVLLAVITFLIIVIIVIKLPICHPLQDLLEDIGVLDDDTDD